VGEWERVSYRCPRDVTLRLHEECDAGWQGLAESMVRNTGGLSASSHAGNVAWSG
jgi:hypothetical protein